MLLVHSAVAKLMRVERKDIDDEDGPDQSTIRPSTRSKPAATGSRAVSSSAVDDYSDLALDEDAGGLAAKMANLKVRSHVLCRSLHTKTD